MEMIIELCGMVAALAVIGAIGIGMRQDYLTMVYGEKFEEHKDYRRLTVASRIIIGIGSVAFIVNTIGLCI